MLVGELAHPGSISSIFAPFVKVDSPGVGKRWVVLLIIAYFLPKVLAGIDWSSLHLWLVANPPDFLTLCKVFALTILLAIALGIPCLSVWYYRRQ